VLLVQFHQAHLHQPNQSTWHQTPSDLQENNNTSNSLKTQCQWFKYMDIKEKGNMIMLNQTEIIVKEDNTH
jgi:hypothetical protein